MSHVIEGPAGTITISDAALHQVVSGAVGLVTGARLRRRRAVELEVKAGRARVALELAAPLGAVLPDLARGVQEHVTAALAGMCGLAVEAVDVAIEELDP